MFYEQEQPICNQDPYPSFHINTHHIATHVNVRNLGTTTLHCKLDYTHMCTRTHTCTHACTHAYTHTHTHTHTHTDCKEMYLPYKNVISKLT